MVRQRCHLGAGGQAEVKPKDQVPSRGFGQMQMDCRLIAGATSNMKRAA
jgi:hypothetical protein